MPHPDFIALADDLTGAAELAAIGRRMGLPSVVCTDAHVPGRRAELVVHDTDSRLCTPAEAARRVRATLDAVRRLNPRAMLFKKVDSVLRGPVAAELAAAAATLGRPRVLLVPANPSLGRTISGGIYRIDGVPLAETAFAGDPHHPVTSSRALDLLGPGDGMPAVSAAPGSGALPPGIVLGDASCIEDLDTWAGRLGDGTLAAGGADFFAAWLRDRGCSPLPASAFPHPGNPVLIIAGSTAPAGRANLAAASASGTAVVPLPEAIVTSPAKSGDESPHSKEPIPDSGVRRFVAALARPGGAELDDPAATPDALAPWIDLVARILGERGLVIVSAAHLRSNAPRAPAAIRQAFAALAAALHRRAALKHLVIEGGATAAAAVRALGWNELTVVREWAPGVASLRPPPPDDVYLTIKPGSYAWPEELRRQLTPPLPPIANHPS